jgi:hypothetical protein
MAVEAVPGKMFEVHVLDDGPGDKRPVKLSLVFRYPTGREFAADWCVPMGTGEETLVSSVATRIASLAVSAGGVLIDGQPIVGDELAALMMDKLMVSEIYGVWSAARDRISMGPDDRKNCVSPSA